MFRIRVLVHLARPAVVVLVSMFSAIGVAQSGHPSDALLLAKPLVAVVALLLFAVALNDLSDQRIDRVNLAGDAGRPLVTGSSTRREMIVVAATAAVLALVASALLAWPAPLVVIAALALCAAYSLRPVRIAERGVVAPLMLPAVYVAVPYLLGIFAVRSALHATDLALLAGLYAGFIGRIVLKDFRDVRGDALFGKRTFLVRHGRRATCVFSGVFLVAGLSVLPFVRAVTPALAVAYLAFLVATLVMLRLLAQSTNPRRDAALVSGIAIVGRGTLVTLYAHVTLVAAHWTAAAAGAFVAGLALVTLGQARAMVCSGGPLTTTTVPPEWEAVAPVAVRKG
jgi:4-hydroxybenzoate polyprenyltransferase